MAACVADDVGGRFAELEDSVSIPDGCEEDVAVFCCDDVGVRADELRFRVDDEERRWLFREELDACRLGTCTELDDPAETADSAELDVAVLEVVEPDWCSKFVLLEEDWTELFSLELEWSEIVSCGETSVFEESPHDTINARHAKTANEEAVRRILRAPLVIASFIDRIFSVETAWAFNLVIE